MKNIIKITAAALCAVTVLGSAIGVSAAIAKAENARVNEPTMQSTDGFIGRERRMVVCVSKLTLYKSRNGDLLSDPDASYIKHKGNEIVVKPVSELVYQVLSSANGTLVGYCYAAELVDKDTKLVAKLPYLWDVITVQIPVENPEAPGGGDVADGSVTQTPEPEYTYEEKLVYTDLVDINEFAYRKDSSIAISGSTVFAQRDLLKAIERVAIGDNTFAISAGYKASALPEGCEIPASSGAIVKLTLIGADGKASSVSSLNGLTSSLSAVGILRYEETDWFYLADYSKYMTSDFSSSDYVYTLFE